MNKFRQLIQILCLLLVAPVIVAQSEYSGVDRIIAVGDVHGDYDAFVEVLRDAGLINRRSNWIAGETHFVQVGDLPDRGPDTDKVIQLMQKLEKQAEDAGGKVHALIGNHEAMNMLGDLRYVHPGEYAAFRSNRSRRYRDRYYEQVEQARRAADPSFEPGPDFRRDFNERFPLGYVEHRQAWAPEGEIGSWVLKHNAVVKIGRNLFLHAGISPAVIGMTLDGINAQIRSDLAGTNVQQPSLTEMEDGPLWYRGLALQDEQIELDHVDALLQFYDVDHIIIGHTPVAGIILPRFDGKVLIIDSGMSAYYGSYGASLLIEADALYAIQEGERYRIPEGISSLEYLRILSQSLTNTPARLLEQIKQTEQITK